MPINTMIISHIPLAFIPLAPDPVILLVIIPNPTAPVKLNNTAINIPVLEEENIMIKPRDITNKTKYPATPKSDKSNLITLKMLND